MLAILTTRVGLVFWWTSEYGRVVPGRQRAHMKVPNWKPVLIRVRAPCRNGAAEDPRTSPALWIVRRRWHWWSARACHPPIPAKGTPLLRFPWRIERIGRDPADRRGSDTSSACIGSRGCRLSHVAHQRGLRQHVANTERTCHRAESRSGASHDVKFPWPPRKRREISARAAAASRDASASSSLIIDLKCCRRPAQLPRRKTVARRCELPLRRSSW